MRRFIIVAVAVVGLWSFAVTTSAKGQEKERSGEAEFNEHCVVCHPGGGNVINASKTLHKKDLEANNIGTAVDIIKLMRNPGSGMPKFDESSVSDKGAKEMAEYILKTFK